MNDAPTLILGLTVTVYWMYVARMVHRVRHDAGHVQKVLIPTRRREKLMWIIWVPVIGGWFFTPLKVALGFGNHFDQVVLPPAMAASSAMLVIRFVSAGIALGCLALSIKTWRFMGQQWRMGIDPSQKIKLLVDGPFARVRHPIYALSILLMLCSVIILPCPTMFLLAAIHITLMHIKARDEEGFLLDTQGLSYADYCRRTGRFLPFVRTRPPSHVPFMDGKETAPDRPMRGWEEGGQYPFRLNFFQQAMLQWDVLHPYNAVHAVRVHGSANVDALREAAWEVSAKAEFGEFARNDFGTAYEYRPLQAIRVLEVAPGRNVEERLAEILTEEINTGFPGPMHHPVRWTVFNEPGEEAHYVVLCYHHVVSDAYGIERLLAAVLRRYLKLPAGNEDSRLTTRLTHVRRSLRPTASPLDYVVAQARLALKHREARSAYRMPEECYGGDSTSVAVRSAPEGLIERLSAGCKRRSVGINDALLAALTSAIAGQTPDRQVSHRRRRITVATVISARKHLPPEQAQDFGLCLSSILAVLRQPDVPMEELVRETARQTRILKANPRRAAAETTLRFFAVRWLWRLATLKQSRQSFGRVFPICGGLSTVFVGEDRFADLAQYVTRYVRACPVGPVTPLLLAPTILNGRLELGLTYRIAGRTREQAEAILDDILVRLEQLADAADPGATVTQSQHPETAPSRPALVSRGPA